MAHRPLLVLSEQRIAAEVRRADERAAGDLAWRRTVRHLAAYCGAVYLGGLLLAYGSMLLSGDAAQVALWGGLLVGNSAILVYLLVLWSWEAR